MRLYARDAGAQSLTFITLILLEEANATSVSQCTVGSGKTKFQPFVDLSSPIRLCFGHVYFLEYMSLPLLAYLQI
jgi:hypothetical protein